MIAQSMSSSDDDDSQSADDSTYRGTRVGPRFNPMGNAITANASATRQNASLPVSGFDGQPTRRDLGMWNQWEQPTVWDAVSYPREEQFNFEAFYLRYERQAEARAIIDKPVNDTWQDDPIIKDEAYEEEEHEQSDFEKKVKEFFEGDHTRRKPIQRLSVADKLGRLGKYSILVIGTSDGRELSTPLYDNEFDGLDDLNYLAAFGEDRIVDINVDTDLSSPRFRLPDSFEVITQEHEDSNVSNEEYESEIIHHSRVVHIPEGTLENDMEGTPALKPVFHELLNIDKIKAASGEGYWRAGYQGLLIQPPEDPQSGQRMKFSDDGKGVEEEIENYIDNFKRTIATRAEISSLNNSVGDPNPHLEANYEAIAAALDLPKAILTGEDRADTASSEDVRQWHQKVGERRNKFAEPVIVKPLIEKLKKYGILPEPQGDGFIVEWPPLDELTEQQEWDLRSQKASTLTQISPGGDPERIATMPELRMLMGWGPNIGSEIDDDTVEEQQEEPLAADEEMLPDEEDGPEDEDDEEAMDELGDEIENILNSADSTDAQANAVEELVSDFRQRLNEDEEMVRDEQGRWAPKSEVEGTPGGSGIPDEPFASAADRVTARDAGIEEGKTKASEMEILIAEDGTRTFATPVSAYDNTTTGVVDSAEEAVENNIENPKVMDAFGGNAADTAIVTDPESGDEYIVKEGIEGETVRASRTNLMDDDLLDDAADTYAAAYLSGNADLHGGNVVVTEDEEFVVVDHDSAKETTLIESSLGVDVYVQQRFYESAVEKAVSYRRGEVELPDDISDEKQSMVESQVDSAIEQGRLRSEIDVPEDV